MFRRIAITVALTVMLFGMYANHQLIKENEHGIRYVANKSKETLLLVVDNFEIAESNVEVLATDIDELRAYTIGCNRTLDLSVLESIGIITNGIGHGSCVAIKQSLLVTAGHCIGQGETWVEINGKKYEILGEWKSGKCDVGFIRIKGRVKPLKLGNMPKVLDVVYRIGTPLSKELSDTVSKAIVSHLDRSVNTWKNVIHLDTYGAGGLSGSPVLNIDGEIIGIHVGSNKPYGISLVEPVSHICEALEDMDNAI
jgi:S1-C subfamily serine protease